MRKRAHSASTGTAAHNGQPGATVPTIHYEQDRVILATYRNLSIAVWGAQATLPIVHEFGKISAPLLRQYRLVSNVQLILQDAPLPTVEARDAFDKLTQVAEKHLACVAMVILGDGFWASAMRSLITSVHWAKQRQFVPRVYTSLTDATAELPSLHTPRTGVRIESVELEQVLRSLLQRVP